MSEEILDIQNPSVVEKMNNQRINELRTRRSLLERLYPAVKSNEDEGYSILPDSVKKEHDSLNKLIDELFFVGYTPSTTKKSLTSDNYVVSEPFSTAYEEYLKDYNDANKINEPLITQKMNIENNSGQSETEANQVSEELKETSTENEILASEESEDKNEELKETSAETSDAETETTSEASEESKNEEKEFEFKVDLNGDFLNEKGYPLKEDALFRVRELKKHLPVDMLNVPEAIQEMMKEQLEIANDTFKKDGKLPKKYGEISEKVESLEKLEDKGWTKPQTQVDKLYKKYESKKMDEGDFISLRKQIELLRTNKSALYDFTPAEKEKELKEIEISRKELEEKIEILSNETVDNSIDYNQKIADIDKKIILSKAGVLGLTAEEWVNNYSKTFNADEYTDREALKKENANKVEQLDKAKKLQTEIINNMSNPTADKHLLQQELNNITMEIKTLSSDIEVDSLLEKRIMLNNSKKMNSTADSKKKWEIRKKQIELNNAKSDLMALNNREEYLKNSDELDKDLDEIIVLLGGKKLERVNEEEQEKEEPLVAEKEEEKETIPVEEKNAEEEKKPVPIVPITSQDEYKPDFAKANPETISKLKTFWDKNKKKIIGWALMSVSIVAGIIVLASSCEAKTPIEVVTPTTATYTDIVETEVTPVKETEKKKEDKKEEQEVEIDARDYDEPGGGGSGGTGETNPDPIVDPVNVESHGTKTQEILATKVNEKGETVDIKVDYDTSLSTYDSEGNEVVATNNHDGTYTLTGEDGQTKDVNALSNGELADSTFIEEAENLNQGETVGNNEVSAEAIANEQAVQGIGASQVELPGAENASVADQEAINAAMENVFGDAGMKP